eukprot:CAMPEP_0197830154 /NCGR_PEP_ID=MMETSP1437-20131217/6758_1 /TAXON_ID=49252 ORGANISM="Eucampia antarctica, Strain CCMP1452" /NCGR_SAMPLE_ID=MMETSP1437 /ASSEMBLY_ACC=CAM_ASM_001096 /LENGTH=373 /DNA_ID=CAMNT_0043432355 /DNA_START=160 /DNA_END=1281 /DNA_ORIENTATION=-
MSCHYIQGHDSPFRSNGASNGNMSARNTLGMNLSGRETRSGRKRQKRRRVIPVVADSINDGVDVSSACSISTQSETVIDKAENNISTEETERSPEKMPTIFSSSRETKYDTYAACLAATEGLRRNRDSYITKIKNKSAVQSADSDSSWKSLISLVNKRKKEEPINENEEEYKRACAQCVLQSTKAIRALGLTVGQFNQIGREIGNDELLKQRVMDQAYLYRVASTINMNKIPLVEDPGSEQLLKGLNNKRRVQMFAKSMTEVEELRAGQLNRLMKALNIDRLPAGISISDPAVLPILNPKIRAVVEAFPLQAEEVVKKYGLNSDEFNEMLMESRSNPLFRRKVEKLMKEKIDNKNKNIRGLFDGPELIQGRKK